MTTDAPARTRTRPPRTDQSTAPTRAALRASGPLAVLSLIVFALALILTGGDELALAVSPVGMASSLLGLASLIALVLGLVALHGRPELRRGAGAVGWTVAMIGTVMTAGGQWTQLFPLSWDVTTRRPAAAPSSGAIARGRSEEGKGSFAMTCKPLAEWSLLFTCRRVPVKRSRPRRANRYTEAASTSHGLHGNHVNSHPIDTNEIICANSCLRFTRHARVRVSVLQQGEEPGFTGFSLCEVAV